MLAASSALSAATAVRIGVDCLRLTVERTPSLARLAMQASVGPSDPGTAQAAFRDELVGLIRDGAEASSREVRRGLHELDAFTRPVEAQTESPPRRPYRVKP
jgi:hypothetical protein